MSAAPDPSFEELAFFRGLEPADRALVLGHFRTEEFEVGKVIFRQDQPADRLYLLLSGRVEIIFKPYDADELTVSVIEAGGVFGWSAALGRSVYTSGAVCTEAARALSIRGNDLRRVCEQHPSAGVVLLERLAEVIAQRLTSTHEHVMDLLRQGLRQP